MQVQAGEVVGIIGRTGAGKSTLVQHLNGLIRPSQPGKVIVDGEDLADPNLRISTIRQKVGLVFQRPEDQLFERLVGDDIAFGPKKMGMVQSERVERVRWAMEMAGLDFERFKDRFTFSLSGGEMRKVAFAGVLALRPSVLILDESTTGIDPRSRREILERVMDWRRQESTTLIMVSSNMEDLAAMADRVYVLDAGQTVMQGRAREIFGQVEELHSYGLGVPQVSQLAYDLRKKAVKLPRIPLTVPEAEEDLWMTLNS
jgi:energy-coupling factor transport system ATP-binding protein